MNKFEQIVFDVLSVILVLFYSYSAVLQPASTQYHRGIYVIITYVLGFMMYKSKHKLMRIVDYLLILLSIFTIGYWILNFEAGRLWKVYSKKMNIEHRTSNIEC